MLSYEVLFIFYSYPNEDTEWQPLTAPFMHHSVNVGYVALRYFELSCGEKILVSIHVWLNVVSVTHESER